MKWYVVPWSVGNSHEGGSAGLPGALLHSGPLSLLVAVRP